VRRARGDAVSASAAALEMERRMEATHRSAAEAVVKLKQGLASKDKLSVRLRERDTELAAAAAAAELVVVQLRDERAARIAAREEVGPHRCYPSRHPTLIEPSFLDLNSIL